MPTIENYIDYVNLNRRIGDVRELSLRLKVDKFVFNAEEFSSYLQTSKELHDVFYNKSITVNLHTDGTAGHISAHLPIKTGSRIEIKYDMGFSPVTGGIFPTRGAFQCETRSYLATQRVTTTIPMTQEQYEKCAELTAKRMVEPGVHYQVLGEGPHLYNCINYMDRHLKEAGIANGIRNLFSLAQFKDLTWRPVLSFYSLHYSDEAMLERFKFDLTTHDLSDADETRLLTQKQHELQKQKLELDAQTQRNAVTSFIHSVEQKTSGVYTAILPPRTSIGVAERTPVAAQAAYASTHDQPTTRAEMTMPGSYVPLLPSAKEVFSAVAKIPRPLSPISFSSTFVPPTIQTTAELQPLIGSLMPAPRMDDPNFSRRTSAVGQMFKPSSMQTLAASLSSPSHARFPDLERRIHERVPVVQMSAPSPSTYLETRLPVPIYVRPLVEDLMPRSYIEDPAFGRRSASAAAQIFQPSPMERLATTFSRGASMDLSQTLQARMQSAAVTPSIVIPSVPTWASTLGYTPRPNPLQAVAVLHSKSKTDLTHTLSDRLRDKR